MAEEGSRLRDWTDWMFTELRETINGAEKNGHPLNRLPQNLNIYFPNIESRAIVLALREDVTLSTGSACTTAVVEPSHVIKALGFGQDRAHGSLRFGLGRFNTNQDVLDATRHVSRSVIETLRRFHVNALI